MSRRSTNPAGRLLAAAAVLLTSALLSAGLSATPAAAATAGPSATVCMDWDFGGTCWTYTADLAEMRTAPPGDNVASSVRVRPGTYLTLYRDPGFTGPCQQFTADVARLDPTFIGNDRASSLRVGTSPSGCPAPQPVRVCRDPWYGGVCQDVMADIPDLRGSVVGDDQITSVAMPPQGMYLVLYQHPNYQGQCQLFTWENQGSVNLTASIVGDDSATSIRYSNTPLTCDNGNQVTIKSARYYIYQLQTTGWAFVCPDAYPYQRGASNNSDAGVTVLSYEPETRRIWTTFTNWNSTGTQYAGVYLYCSK